MEIMLLIISLILLYYLWIRKFTYWERRGFPFAKPPWPFGSLHELMIYTRYQGHATKEYYDQYKQEKYVGVIIGRRPFLLLCSPDIIKSVMQKDFNHFTDRINVDAVNEDPLSKHIFNVGGDSWKALRTHLTPTFSSGKLKMMFPLFQKCAESLKKYVLKNNDKVIDVKNIMSRFTTDVIVSCAFGLETNSVLETDSEFHRINLKIFPSKVSFKRKFINGLNNMMSEFDNLLNPSIIPRELTIFFRKLVKDTIDYREKSQFKRNDVIDLLIDMKDKGKIQADKYSEKQIDITDDDLVAQVFVFVAAGFETSSSVISYCLFEVSKNNDIQTRIREEIINAIKEHGELNYKAIMEMQYLDQVVSETMRKYPTIPVLSRKCTADYAMPDQPNRKLDKGIRVLIPVYGLHTDPEYFPEPEKFDPERFSPENKSKIKPFTYLPFGEGPRLCIGMRFGLLQTKMGVATILKNFIVTRPPEMKTELDFSPSTLITMVKNPITLKFTAL